MDDEKEMRAFWDEKAVDNPLWYVHSGLDFDAPDVREFFASGEREVDDAMRFAGVAGGALAVDIGVGAARLTKALAARFDRVWACDVSPRMVEVARRNLRDTDNVDLVAVPGDGSLALRTGVADFVLTLQVLQHIPSRRASLRYIAESGRVLRPGGRAVVHVRSCLTTLPLPGWAELALRAVVERVRRARREPPGPLDSPAWRGARVGLWQARAAARRGGLVVRGHRWISKRGASLLILCEKPEARPGEP